VWNGELEEGAPKREARLAGSGIDADEEEEELEPVVMGTGLCALLALGAALPLVVGGDFGAGSGVRGVRWSRPFIVRLKALD
jgi:hypothetical protein